MFFTSLFWQCRFQFKFITSLSLSLALSLSHSNWQLTFCCSWFCFLKYCSLGCFWQLMRTWNLFLYLYGWAKLLMLSARQVDPRPSPVSRPTQHRFFSLPGIEQSSLLRSTNTILPLIVTIELFSFLCILTVKCLCRYIPLSPILEGFVILKENPDYHEEN